MNQITLIEQSDLQDLERVIESGKQSFVNVGLALLTIRDRRLYRKNHSSFEDYCQKRWGWTASYGRKLISATSAIQGLTEKSATIVSTAGAARALAAVPEPEREKVVAAFGKSARPITAKAINETYAAINTAKAEAVVDATGYNVPEDLLPLWNRGPEVDELLRAISKVKTTVERALLDKDLLYAEINNSVFADIANAYSAIKRAKPYAVCPKCQGRKTISNHCTTCRRRGIVSKFMWDSAITKEDKEMRAAVVAKQKENPESA